MSPVGWNSPVAGTKIYAERTTSPPADVPPVTNTARPPGRLNLALVVGPRNRPAEARDALRTLDPAREPMRAWYSYFSVYASAAHALGDYEDELRSARQARALFPDDIRAVREEAVALATLGKMAELERINAST